MSDQKNLLGKSLEFFECDHCPYKGCDAEWFEIRKPESKFYGMKLPFCPRCGWEMRSERLGNMPRKPNKDDAGSPDSTFANEPKTRQITEEDGYG